MMYRNAMMAGKASSLRSSIQCSVLISSSSSSSWYGLGMPSSALTINGNNNKESSLIFARSMSTWKNSSGDKIKAPPMVYISGMSTSSSHSLYPYDLVEDSNGCFIDNYELNKFVVYIE